MRFTTFTKRLRLTAALGTGLLIAAVIPGTVSATIVGSGHDLSGTVATALKGNQICVYCHTPHNSDTSVTDAPLWNHKLSTVATYAVYSGTTTLNAVTGQPSGVSKLCLSCHDGTVAVDSFGNVSGSTFIGSISTTANFGTDLSNDHPISFTYDDALAASDGELHAPSSTTITIADGQPTTQTGFIADVLLFTDSVECASCHDVHNTQVSGENYALLRDDMAGSELCLNCHDK